MASTEKGHENELMTWASAVGGLKGAVAPWIFIHGTDKVERGSMVLFFGLVFFFSPPPPGNFALVSNQYF